MANEIKDLFGSATAMTISLGSLASSTTGAGRQSDMVDNSTTRYGQILLMVKIKQGTSPTGNRGAYIHLIRGIDGVRDDNAGTSDAAITILNAPQIGGMQNASAPSTGDVIYRSFLIDKPGPSWGIAISHDMVAALDSTNGNHSVKYQGVNPEIQ